MRTVFLLSLAWLIPSTASSVTYAGGDYAGADLIPANGDIVTGVFTNVGEFRVGG